MKTRHVLRAAAVVFGLFGAASVAQATTITFEDVGYFNGVNSDPDNAGLHFNSTLDTVDIGPGSYWSDEGPAHSGRQAILNNAGGDGMIITSDSGTWTFNDLWMQMWSGGTYTGTVTGTLNGNTVFSITEDFSDHNWVDVVAGAALIDTLTIHFPYTYDIFLVDDITFNGTGVPAPGALALLGFGLVGLGAARRRKTS